MREQREVWKEEQLQREEDSKDGTSSLADAVRSEIAIAKEEAEVAKKLRVELREMRAKQQHRDRQRRRAGSADAFPKLVELEHAVQQRVTKREKQLQDLRLSLTELGM